MRWLIPVHLCALVWVLRRKRSVLLVPETDTEDSHFSYVTEDGGAGGRNVPYLKMIAKWHRPL